MSKKLKMTNSKQFETLVAEMEKNPSFANGFARSRGTLPANYKEKWDEIAIKVNAVGPPMREGLGWQKVWRDLKFNIKKKIESNEGRRRFKQLHLSALENTVASLIQLDKQPNSEDLMSDVESEIDPEPFSEDEVFTGENAFEPESLFFTEDSTISTNKHTITSTQAKKNSKQTRRAGKNDRNSLLERHSKMQGKVLCEMSQTMISIKNSLKILCQLQEKQLAFLKRKNEREEELFEDELEIKKCKLEIKKAELRRMTMGSDIQVEPESGNGLGAEKASLYSLNTTTKSSINNSFSSPIASTSAISRTRRHSGVFSHEPIVAKTSKVATSTSSLADILDITPTTTTSSALLSSTSNATSTAGSVVKRCYVLRGPGANMRHLSGAATNTRIQVKPVSSTTLASATTTPSASLSCLPTLTRNPHFLRLSQPSNQQNVVSSRANYAQTNSPDTMTTAAKIRLKPIIFAKTNTNVNSKQIVTVSPTTSDAHQSVQKIEIVANSMPAAEETILPDECKEASEIKTEKMDSEEYIFSF